MSLVRRIDFSRLTSEHRRWAVAGVCLVTAGLGIGTLFGVGWGLAVIGAGGFLVVLSYDPEKAKP